MEGKGKSKFRLVDIFKSVLKETKPKYTDYYIHGMYCDVIEMLNDESLNAWLELTIQSMDEDLNPDHWFVLSHKYLRQCGLENNGIYYIVTDMRTDDEKELYKKFNNRIFLKDGLPLTDEEKNTRALLAKKERTQERFDGLHFSSYLYNLIHVDKNNLLVNVFLDTYAQNKVIDYKIR